jgi:hypothetical protein
MCLWEAILGWTAKVAHLQELVPQAEASFEEWWHLSSQRVEGLAKKGFNSLVTLGAWCFWMHRNRCVFDGIRSSVAVPLQLDRDEALMWSMAGAKGLSSLQSMAGVG